MKTIKDARKRIDEIIEKNNKAVCNLRKELLEVSEKINTAKETMKTATARNDFNLFKEEKIKEEFLEAKQKDLERRITSLAGTDSIVEETEARSIERVIEEAKANARREQIEVIQNVISELKACYQETNTAKNDAQTLHNRLYAEVWRKGKEDSSGAWREVYAPRYNSNIDRALSDIIESLEDVAETGGMLAGLGRYQMQVLNLSPPKAENHG